MDNSYAIVMAAAVAPDEIPDWFVFEKQAMPKLLELPKVPVHLQQLVKSWEWDPCIEIRDYKAGDPIIWYVSDTEYILNQRKLTGVMSQGDVDLLIDYANISSHNAKVIHEWERHCEEDRYFAWRIYYAKTIVQRLLSR